MIKKFGKRAVSLIILLSLVITVFAAAIPRAGAVSMNVSDNGINLIKQFEGFSPYKFWDYSQWSIGYGTVCGANEYPNGISEEQATVLLKNAAASAVSSVNSFLNRYGLTVNQNQFDAMVSFTYNLGNVWVQSDTFTLRNYILEGIGNHSDSDFYYAFGLWVKAGGVVLEGLVRRRAAEAALFCTPCDFRLSYNANGGNGAPSSVVLSNAGNVTVSSSAPSRSGYTFNGWSTSPDGPAMYSSGSLIWLNSNTTLYAVWLNNFSLSYDLRGGSNGPENSYIPNGKIVVLSNIVPEKTGYIFLGWTPDSNEFDTPEYYPTSNFIAPFDVTLYAVWQKSAIIEYNANGGNGAPGSTVVSDGSAYQLSGNAPKYSGYSFLGWSADPYSSSAEYQPNQIISLNGDITLFAVWQRYSTIALETNGGVFSSISDVVLGDLTGDGIVTAEDYTYLYNIVTNGVPISGNFKKTADLNLDGIIDGLDLIILEDYLSGSLATLPAQCVKAGGVLSNVPSPEKQGYFFNGWYGEGGIFIGTGSDKIDSAILPGTVASNTLYAIWSNSPMVGDVDLSGSVTVSDVVALRSIIINGEQPDEMVFAAADVDGDGIITVSDVVALRSIIM